MSEKTIHIRTDNGASIWFTRKDRAYEIRITEGCLITLTDNLKTYSHPSGDYSTLEIWEGQCIYPTLKILTTPNEAEKIQNYFSEL